MDWITINIPWAGFDECYVANSNVDHAEAQKTMKARGIAHFGRDVDAVGNALPKDVADRFNALVNERLLQGVSESYEESRDAQEAAREAIYPTTAEFRALKDYRDLWHAWNVWREDQPELTAERQRYQDFCARRDQATFVGQNLNVPGTLVEVNTGGVIRQVLIGDVNPAGSAAGADETDEDIDRNAIVIRYCTVWTRES